jgi:[protein-PII] uridylyltransferase
MSQDPRSLRAHLESRHRDIAAAHHSGATAFATCAALTSVMDGAIRSACASLPEGTMDHIAILALGGFGRAELCPHSDIDVMVLCDSGKLRAVASESAKTFLHMLWDAGVNVGHSVRTIEDALALYGNTFDAWTSMIESRYVCGNEELASRFYAAVRRHFTSRQQGWFIKAVFNDVESRHERYGSSIKLLEPDIKKSAGGLRDLQAAFWLHRGTDEGFFTQISPEDSAIRTFLDTLLENGSIAHDVHGAATTALEFLLRARHEMHFRREGMHDTLEYALQVQVAEGLGYGSSAGLRSVEIFMREYYRHARTVQRLLQTLGQRFREGIEPARPWLQRGSKLGSGFVLYDDALSVDSTIRQFSDPRLVLEAFALGAEYDVGPDLRLRGVLERSAEAIRPEHVASPDLAACFRRILSSRRVAATLHDMNDADVLARYIPEFGELVAFFQHNVYHYYTADEHTLIAIANAENLREKQGILREVFRNLRRKDILYLALLLHDIAKPMGVGDHEITGVEVSRGVLHRLGMDDEFPEVAFLVRNHLVMEQTAFRRNVHDPATLKDFAARFDRPELLDYLYILTYADLSALNVNVWTEWKSALLQELYQRTSEVLHRNLSGMQIDEYHQEKHVEAVDSVVDALSATMPREHVERHLQGLGDASYLALFSEKEIARHILQAQKNDLVSSLFTHAEGYTEITVIGHDAPFVLSKFCGVLAANDANIFDASIFTRDDGIIIDRFRVSDAATKLRLEERTCVKISSDLRQVSEGKLDIEHLFQEHRKKWKRRPKPPSNPTVRTDVEFEDHPRYTIIDVYAPDAVGFLYRVTETMSALGLDIYFAKIATRVDGIVDSFYTLDRAGKQVTDPSRRTSIRRGILEAIQRLFDERPARNT